MGEDASSFTYETNMMLMLEFVGNILYFLVNDNLWESRKLKYNILSNSESALIFTRLVRNIALQSGLDHFCPNCLFVDCSYNI